MMKQIIILVLDYQGGVADSRGMSGKRDFGSFYSSNVRELVALAEVSQSGYFVVV